MTMTIYPNGYGLREKPPECQGPPETMDCPCCGGAGHHDFGAGMDADSVDCRACGGWGYFIAQAPKRTARV